MIFDLPETAELYALDRHGIYIPQYFAESVRRECVTGVSAEDWTILEEGPDHEWYWDTWDSVLSNARITSPETGVTYSLWQDGDLWLVPADWSPCDEG